LSSTKVVTAYAYCFRVFPTLSCVSFKVSCLTFRSLIHSKLILVQGGRHGSSFNFLQADNHFSQQHVWRDCLFSIVCFWWLCQKSVGLNYLSSYLGLLFCPTGLHICFCASTMLFLLLRLFSIVWNQVLWSPVLFFLAQYRLGYL
jgi:hypothetical protein